MDPDPGPFVALWPKKKRASVRVDPDLKIEIRTDGTLGNAKIEGDSLVLRYRRQKVARVTGPLDKLLLLSEVLAPTAKLTPTGLKATELPRDIVEFRATVEAAREEVATLLGNGRVLVEAAERLVCALYALPADLEDEVVAHAIARATVGSGLV